MLGGAGLGEAVGVGAGLDDVAAEGEAVDDGGAEPGVGEGLGPAAEGLVGGDGDAGFLLPFGQDLEEELGAAAVEFHVAELVDAEQVDAAVAVDGLGELPVVGGLDELVDELGGEGVADAVAGHGGLGAQGDEQVGLAGAGVADQAERQSFPDPVAGGEGVDDGGVDVRVGVEVEGAQRFLAGEPGGPDLPLGAAAVAVVALGHEQLGEEAAVGHLLAGGGVGEVGELGADGGQAQHPAGLVDGGVGGLLGQSAAGLGGHGVAVPSCAVRLRRSSWS